MIKPILEKIYLPKVKALILIFPIMAFFFQSCKYELNSYKSKIDFYKHSWLRGKKIFIDAGHGGKGRSDRFRIGPGGITEEEINLKVALILEDMLKRCGAKVEMTRRRDVDVSLDDRALMIRKANPRLMVSIHHNGSPRRVDKVNYPIVLIWGSKHVRPASYDFAGLLLREFNKRMDVKGKILSDFSVYNETGTRILRKTRYVCPGVIGEFGFFSDEKQSMRLSSHEYNIEEAEAYFKAISEYFRRVPPVPEVIISSPIDNRGYLINRINDASPLIAIRFTGGGRGNGILLKRSLKITLDKVKVGFRKLSHNLYQINYGKKLYPGGHSIRFQYKSLNHQDSMIYISSFTVKIGKGDYRRLVRRGLKLVRKRRTAKEGLRMLLSALSMGLTDPGADKLLWKIAWGFKLIGDHANSDYYLNRLYYFYPGSYYSGKLKKRIYKYRGHRYPVEYHGKKIEIKYMDNILKTVKE
ncbi:N-acetylmuramoyl-L-alanine amidase [Spirochaetota bacterium]